MSDEQGYGRVTNPERYRVLHVAADRLVQELQEGYRVMVAAIDPAGRQVAGGVLSATRISPTDGGASVTLTKTGFPGVLLHLDEDRTRAFPTCGCDACDEQPEQAVEMLREDVRAVARTWPARGPES